MKILSITFLKKNKEFLSKEIKLGKIFIYPTDTVYGMGCDANNEIAIKKIYEIKKRDKKQVLIIVPNKKWIEENTQYNKIHQNLLNKLPGKYSFIITLKNTKLIAKNARNKNTIGIRIPNSEFTKILEIPFVTTSVNFSGKPCATKISEIPLEILNKVDYIIKTKESVCGKSSTIYDITKKKLKVLRI